MTHESSRMTQTYFFDHPTIDDDDNEEGEMSTEKEVSDVSMRSDADECTEGNHSNTHKACNAGEKNKLNEGNKDNVAIKEVCGVQDKAGLEEANGSGMDNVYCTFVNNTNKAINSSVEEVIKVSNVENPVSYAGTLTKNIIAADNKLFTIPTSVNSKGDKVVLFDEVVLFVNNTNKAINSSVEEVIKVSNVENPVSYAGTLTTNIIADDNKLFTIPTSVNSKGDEVVLFDEELVMEGCEKWKLTVCGYFVGCKMHINVLKYNIRRMWTRFGLKDIVVDADEMCFFKFKDEEGMKYVIDQSPWIVNGKPLIVQKWDPENIIEKETLCKIPVWIRLYNVPLEAWSTKGRLGYARVLVEVDAGKEYLDKIEINYVDAMKKVKLTKWVKVEYSWKPDRCMHCKVFGHTVNYCKAKQMNGKNENNQEASANGIHADNEGFVEVKNRKKNNGNAIGINNGTQGNKQGYKVNVMNVQQRYVVKQKAPEQKRKEGENKSNPGKGKSSVDSNGDKWMEALNEEELEDNVCQDDRIIVDKYILMKAKPPPEEMMKWTYDMKLYFKYIWDVVNRENESSNEEDIIEEVNATKYLVVDEIGGGDSQLLN
ncbi:RNA-directed DNA polymerase, eukaryota, reverse transcriptase zinc-binding domain protein [Tanacetum coccineum]